MTEWTVDVARRDGTLICRVPTAAVTRHTRILNGVDYVELDVSLHDAGLLAAGLGQDIILGYEARIQRDGVTVLVGPWLSLDASGGRAKFVVMSWWWYFTRRYMGDAERVDYVTNGGFETGDFTGWSTFGSVATSIDGVNVVEGDKAAILDASTNGAAGIAQTLAGVSHGYTPGLGFFFSAECNVEAGAIVDPDTLLFKVTATDGVNTIDFEVDWSENIGTDQYQRVDGYLILSAGPTWTATVELYAVDGRIRWDSARAFFQDSVTVAYPGEDQSVLFTALVGHAQDPAFGKSALGIGVVAPPTGVVVLLGYEHYLHENIGDAVVALTERVDGFDFHCDYDTDDLVLDYPRRGAVKPRWRIGPDRNIAAGGSVTIDGSQVENWHVVMGDPAWSEEGGAVDAGELGGLTLEGVSRAPVGYPLRMLGKLAAERVHQRKRRVVSVSVEVTGQSGDIAAGLEPGDTITAGYEEGWLVVDIDARIVEITEFPRVGDDGTDLVTMALAPVDSSGS